MTNYYQRNSSLLEINSDKIRNCQRGAYYATLAWFSRKNSPCLIALPTGAGKTALMMAICFGLKAQRVLVVTPTDILRSQTYVKFSSQLDLRKTNALSEQCENPKTFKAVHNFSSENDWNQCLEYDVVIATPNITSPSYPNVSNPPKGLFDLLIIDEGHHSPAPTWYELLQTMNKQGTKSVLLTATPYRKDRVEIPADLIYDYPISLAINDAIFIPVAFHEENNQIGDRDSSLIRKCKDVREEMWEKYQEWPLILVKTNSIKHAEHLENAYNEAGLNVKAIHSEKAHTENEETLSDLQSKRIDGIVAVGMVGEGLDIPNIKLAVFHRNPQSLPYTIQLIGRLARSETQIYQGAVIGYADDFSRETYKLYEKSPDWLKLIPELEQKLLGARVGYSERGSFVGDNYIFNSDLNPYFSTTALEWKDEPKVVDITKVDNWTYSTKRRHDQVVYSSKYKEDTVIIITRTKFQPDWLISNSDSYVQQERFDLHIIYQNKKIVLEYTTDSQIMSMIRTKLFEDKLSKVKANPLNRVLSKGDGAYVVVGLKNSSGISYGNPTYKMLMGREAQDSIRNTDNKVFFPGHALMRLERGNRESEIRGISYMNSKIWSLKRSNIQLFRNWCFMISSLIQESNVPNLPGLEGLRKMEIITIFPEKPLALLHNSYLLNRSVMYESNIIMGNNNHGFLGNLFIKEFSSDRIKFSIGNLDAHFEISFNSSLDMIVKKIDGEDYTIIIDPIDNVIKRFSIEEYFNKFLPTIIFPDGSALSDGFFSKPTEVPKLDDSVVIHYEWDGCDIHSEEEDTIEGLCVQNFIVQDNIQNNTIIFRDHAAYELADILSIDLRQNHICLFHIKSAGVKDGTPQEPGARKSDMENVLQQGITSTKWIKNSLFADELERRIEERHATQLIHGSKDDFELFREIYKPALFSFEVVIVQPALDMQQITDSLKTMIASVQDFVISSQAKFKILCS